MEALDAVDTPYPLLRKVAEKCINPDPDKRYKDIAELRLALADRHSNKIYLFVIAFLVIMMGILLWLNSPYRPIPKNCKLSIFNCQLSIVHCQLKRGLLKF